MRNSLLNKNKANYSLAQHKCEGAKGDLACLPVLEALAQARNTEGDFIPANEILRAPGLNRKGDEEASGSESLCLEESGGCREDVVSDLGF